MKLFKRKSYQPLQPEERFEMIFELIRELPKADFSRLIDGIKLAWEGYDKALRVKTREEKENADIYDAEKELSK